METDNSQHGIRARRAALGWSQEDLARKVRELSGKSFTQQTLAKLEKTGGERSLYLRFINAALDQAEGRSPVQAPPAPAAAAASLLTTEEQFLLDRFREASKERRDQTIAMLLAGAQAVAPSNGAKQRTVAEIFADLDIDMEQYYAEPSAQKKKEIQLEIGSRVIKFLDRRRQQYSDPLPEYGERRKSSKP